MDPTKSLISTAAGVVVSTVRTVIVPFAVGLVAYLAGLADVATDPEAAATITSALAFAYYFAVRALEMKWPKAGWLLLIPRPPAYVDSDFAGFLKSLSRTFVPIAVGLLAITLARFGFDVEMTRAVAAFATAGSTGVYYTSVRAAEAKVPKTAGFLLGGKGAPTYPPENGELGGGD